MTITIDLVNDLAAADLFSYIRDNCFPVIDAKAHMMMTKNGQVLKSIDYDSSDHDTLAEGYI